MTGMNIEAVLLRSVDFGESDRIVHLLTPAKGRLTVIAKGARRSVKRFPGTLDLFNHLRIHVTPRRRAGLPFLQKAELISPFLGLRENAGRYALACQLIEVFDRMIPENAPASDAESAFAFGTDALRMLETAEPTAALRILLELRTLDVLGLRPELRACVRCGDEARGTAPIGFHVGEGGVVCARCARQVEGLLRVHLGTLRTLEQSLRLDLAGLSRLSLGKAARTEAARLVGRFQHFHVGIELRSERFLDLVLGHSPQGPA